MPLDRFALLGLTLALAACGRDEGPAGPPIPPPTAEQIGRDLVGLRFDFFEDAEGVKRWTIEEGEVRELAVEDGVTSADGATHRARVRLTLAAPNRTIRGRLHAYYRRDGEGWVFDEAARAEGNWGVAEIAAVVYAASPARTSTLDSLTDARDVVLEPIARYAEGLYTAPFDPYRDAIEAVLDRGGGRAALSDSLWEAEVERLNGQIAERYFNRTWTLFLLQPSKAPEAVRVRASEASFEGCQYLTGTVRAPSEAFAREAALATTSSTMGGDRAPGRPLRADEERGLLRLARERLAARGAPAGQLDRLRPGRLLAADLDGDGIEEWMGEVELGEHPEYPSHPADALVLAVDGSGPVPHVLLERGLDPTDYFMDLDLLGALDVDGDGRLEVLLREVGYEGHQFLILTRSADGAWEETFRGGGGGC